MTKLLVVDDESPIRESISMFMSEKGYQVHTAATLGSAMTAFKKLTPEVVVLDIRLPDGSGLDALSLMHDFYPLSKIIMITAFQEWKMPLPVFMKPPKLRSKNNAFPITMKVKLSVKAVP